MQIYVENKKTGEFITLEVNAFDTIWSVKEKIEDSEGIPACEQRLVFLSGQLDDER